MSLSSAISSALSGLRATSTAAGIVGNNLANATNENYSRRELVIQANPHVTGGGVDIVGIRRHNDPALSANWRDASQAASMADRQTRDAKAIHALYGDPTQAGSLTSQLTKFESSLISAAQRPDSVERLSSAVTSLDGLVKTVNAIGDGIQRERFAADQEISRLANRMNDVLDNLHKTNVRILEAKSQGNDPSGLLDLQDQLVDELSGITEIHVFPRDHQTISVYSSGGAVLLDTKAAEISFDAAGTMSPHFTIASGHLSQLNVNGAATDVGASSGRLQGGQLGALFEFRDSTSVAEQQEIDSFAFELAQRLNDPSIDPTRAPGDLGFITDLSAVVDPANTVGLSSRLQTNSTLLPAQGGDPSLLRDGLSPVSPGPEGNSALISALQEKLSSQQVISVGKFAGESISLERLAVRQTNRAAAEMTRREEVQVFAATQSRVLTEYRQQNAVDSDAELQKLMMLEQSYAANAQVLRSVDEMMDTLLGIT